MGSSQEHTDILYKTLLLLGALPFCRIWRNETGMALNIRTMEPLKYGLVGSSDILGILADGRLLCIEIKSGNAKQSSDQKKFEAMIRRFNGVYIVARSPESAKKQLTEIWEAA